MKRSMQVLAWLAVSFAAAGALDAKDAIGHGIPTTQFAHTVLVMVLTYAWCRYHALESRVTVAGWVAPAAGILPLVGVPFYLYRGFGLRVGTAKLLKCIAYVVGIFALYSISEAVFSGTQA